MTEQRGAKRCKVQISAECESLGYPQISCPVKILNVNPGGFSVLSQYAFEKGQQLDIHFYTTPKEQLLFKTKVIYCRENRVSRQCVIGVKVLECSVPSRKIFDSFYDQLLTASGN